MIAGARYWRMVVLLAPAIGTLGCGSGAEGTNAGARRETQPPRASAVLPNEQTIREGSYRPLSRPIFIYVATKSLARPEVRAFAQYYLDNAKRIAEEVGYVPLSDRAYELAGRRLANRQTGTLFAGESSKPGVLLDDLLQQAAGDSTSDGPAAADPLSGGVRVDGSSTVFPITEGIAEDFQQQHPEVRVPVGVSGTGGGFKKFCSGETDISNASRPIKQAEIDAAAKNGIEYIELPVAYDGLSVLVNTANDFVNDLTVAELKRIWQPGSTVRQWSDVRPDWPKRDIKLYGPGTDSGTFDYFTEAVCGKSGASRDDYFASEDDNQLVQGISGDQDSLGYFGYSYYVTNRDQLKLVPIVPE